MSKKSEWQTQKFEICYDPADDELVQYAVIHIRKLHKFDIPESIVSFFMREIP